jgi:hypothetical protein
VFQPAEAHESGTGPMVRWIRPSMSHNYYIRGMCNVYDGWVEKIG